MFKKLKKIHEIIWPSVEKPTDKAIDVSKNSFIPLLNIFHNKSNNVDNKETRYHLKGKNKKRPTKL